MYDDFITERSIEEQWDEYYNYCMQLEYEEYLKGLEEENAFGTDDF